MSHGVWQAYTTFALNDIARRARLGASPDDHRRSIGELFAPMTSVAAANEHAWFPVQRSATELVEPTADNRMVSYPYTKYTIAVMDVDMAGALVLASHSKADELGVPPERRVYLRGWAYGNDPWYPAAREDLSRSPAIRAVAAATLDQAGVGIDDVAHLDLYSCFASSVTIACDELGIDPFGDRDLTVTGGLPFAGGPASNYMLHSVAAMAERLREDPGSLGVVSGVGMHLTKHVYAAYSTEPGPLSPPDAASLAVRLKAEPQRQIAERYAGAAEVVSYTVQHSRDRGPERAVIVAELPTGERCYATATDPELLGALEAEEHVGRKLDLTPQDDVNIARA
jgi:acetyl-CoA C-acetyltransferase